MNSGIHHITAISGRIDRTVDFYRRVLGLRLVKRTVNYDDPATYHLYFGDETGRPGTILTFFPWPGGGRGQIGRGQAAVTALLIPRQSLGFWTARLIHAGIRYEGPTRRFGEPVLGFADPDGMRLELIGTTAAEQLPAWEGGDVPGEQAIRGIHSVTLWVDGDPGTRDLLVTGLGLGAQGEEDGRLRLQSDAPLGAIVDLRQVGGFWRGAGGVGTVHHVAFRAPDDIVQHELRRRLVDLGMQVTPVRDRQYFRSIYFREPGGVLFEIATDSPGFVADESSAALGSRLALPAWLEPERARIAAGLPEFPADSTDVGAFDAAGQARV
jgi:glyoxalase family protein